jgi:hypothetical protein
MTMMIMIIMIMIMMIMTMIIMTMNIMTMMSMRLMRLKYLAQGEACFPTRSCPPRLWGGWPAGGVRPARYCPRSSPLRHVAM